MAEHFTQKNQKRPNFGTRAKNFKRTVRPVEQVDARYSGPEEEATGARKYQGGVGVDEKVVGNAQQLYRR